MKKFKNNLMSLFKTKEELIDFLINNNAFNEKFVRTIIETKEQEYFKDTELTYDVSYKNDKILVDITKNDVFSYLDSESELLKKMKLYIKTEQYEKAHIMKKYFNAIDLEF